MTKALLAAAMLALSASCRKKPALLSPGDAVYRSSDGTMSFEIPKDWRVLENQGGGQRASFFGPSSGPKPYSVSIGVYFYGPGSAFAKPEDWARAQALSAKEASPLSAFSWKGRAAYEIGVVRAVAPLHRAGPGELRRDRAVLIPASGGFYVLVYSAPEGEAGEQAAAFDRMLQSLELPAAGR